MWIVKLGGSLNTDPRLPEWLELLVQLGGGRVAVVCGGGVFANEVRRSQTHWRFNDLAAHNMAVLAMAQTTYMAQALNSKLRLAASKAEIRDVLRGGHTALWLPLELVSERPNANTNWDVASDSIALDLARKLNAERLVVVKSCAIDPAASLAELTQDGILDRRFASFSKGAAFPIDIVHKDDLARMRSLLLADGRPTGD
jgi:aspartokinase-like uncharacterized kinase